MEPHPERVVPFDIAVKWDPNSSDPLLIQQSDRALLSVGSHPDDADHRFVHLRLFGCSGVVVSSPNDEARSGHRLWNSGLSDCLWAGLLFKETTAECVGTSLEVHRSERELKVVELD